MIGSRKALFMSLFQHRRAARRILVPGTGIGGNSMPGQIIRAMTQRGRLAPYAVAALMVACSTAVGRSVEQVVSLPNISLVYLPVILISATRYGLWPAVATALLSVAAYNWFFIPPLYTFTVSDPANVVALAAFLAVAVFASVLAARAREQTVAARRHASTTTALYDFSSKLAEIANVDDLLWATVHQIAAMLKVEVVLLLPEADGIVVRAGFPPEDTLDAAELTAAAWCWDRDAPTGRGTDAPTGGKRLFLPLRTERGRVGVIGIMREGDGLLAPAERQLLNALADQAAVAIERIHLARDIDAARLRAETDRLRAALLTSVSHDLRTPLASIIGALTSLRSYGLRFDEATRHELLGTAIEEAERLNRFVANLLDMTRLDAGTVAPRREPADPDDLIAAAARRAQRLTAQHRLKLEINPDLPQPMIDFALCEQALFNLLDNAAKYAPEGTAITVRASRASHGVSIDVLDEGPGIPAGELERIFDKFHRVRNADRQRAGTGLGLAIARGFVTVQGGSLGVTNRSDRRGACFTMWLPE